MKKFMNLCISSCLCALGNLEGAAMNENSVSTISIDYLHNLNIDNPFFIEPSQVENLLASTGLSIEQLMQQLVPIAQSFAKPAISNYYVGAVGLGKSGALYMGVNLEFPGVPLNATVHAEQFLVANARNHHEKQLVSIALSAAPCGHCRQFMQEMENCSDLKIATQQNPDGSLSLLLPSPFGPAELDLESHFMSSATSDHAFTMEYSLQALALQAAFHSYAPYSHSKSGIALETSDHHIYSGSYLENAGFNPSMSPLQVALVALVANQRDFHEITRALLIEQESAKISQESTSKELLHHIAPNATFLIKKTKG